MLTNYTRYSFHDSEFLVIDTGLDDGVRYEPGSMFDYVGICLTSDYPYKLYNFSTASLGKKMQRYVQSDPREPNDYFSHLIKTQASPDETFYPNVGYHEFSVADSARLDPLYVAPFDWDL